MPSAHAAAALDADSAVSSLTQSAHADSATLTMVQVVGPVDVGKSSLCRLLLNYAVRSAWNPTMVDLDIGGSRIALPSTLVESYVAFHVGVLEGRTYHKVVAANTCCLAVLYMAWGNG